MSPVFETLEQLPLRKDNRLLPPVVSFETGFAARTTAVAGLPYAEFVGDLNKSPSDERDYRFIRLPNGLVAMVVHDSDESKACASISVNIGSLADPPELQGLAHFCEHLLFMGTTKYPKENEYSEYLSAHGGYSNAYTDLENTCYYFEVTYDALEGALDRFSQFFIDPLFTDDCTEREVRAVDSEHKKNIQSDMWRQYQLEKELSSPAHPFSMFSTGNYDTLMGAAKRMGVDLRQRLLDFHAAYYSSDIMRLVIVGRDSLDQLTEWAVAKFSPILSKGLTKPLFKGHPLTAAEMGQLVRFRSVRQMRSLDMTFALPDIKPYYLLKPAHYIGSLLGHEGPGSVLSYLKKRGWATGIVAGRAPMSADGFDMFCVSVSLTKDGMAHYADVVRAVFAYIRLLQEKGPQRYFYDELRRIGAIEYRFMENSEAVTLASNLAATMQSRYLPPADCLSEGTLLGDFDADLLSWVQGFLRPDNVRILLSAHDVSGELDRTEKYYDINYRTDPLPDELLRPTCDGLEYGELHLPEPNAFIPDDLSIKSSRRPGMVPTDEPTLLRYSEGVELWFKQDDRFFLPRGNIRLLIETPRANESPLNGVMTQLYTLILRDALAELTYDAGVSGLWFDIRDTLEGVIVHVDGFNDKMARLLRILIETLKSHRVSDTQFSVYSRELRKKLDNVRHLEPYGHAQNNTSFLNQSAMWRYTDKLSVFDMVTKERLQEFISSLFEETRILMLAMGNMSEADALVAADTVSAVLASRPLPQYARSIVRSLLHAPGRYMHHALMPERDNVNSCIDVSVYAGLADDNHERVVLDLLTVVLNEPFFDQLRTKEQLGYITYSTSRKYNAGQMTLRLVVQSEASPLYLNQRIDSFMGGFRARLAEMTQKRFESYVNSLRVTLEEKLKNLNEESSRYWGQLCSGYYAFDRIACNLRILATLEKSDLIAFWDRYVNPDTAAAYTCLAMTMWSTRITQPTMAELARFPETTIALHGCLEHDGARGLSLEAVDVLVRELGTGREAGDEDAALERVLEAYMDAVEDPKAEDVVKALDKIRKPASYVRLALEAARGAAGPAATATNGRSGSAKAESSGASAGTDGGPSDRLANIGGVQMPSGMWAFQEAAAFKATLRMSAVPMPMRKLVPKHPTPAPAAEAV